MKRVRSKLTYANVVSSVCLFVVLGGSAYAASQLPRNSVGTKQLQNGSVSLAKLSSSAKKSLKGAVGAPGAAGPAGLAGKNGGTNTIVREGALEFESVAFCAPDESAVGGGGVTLEKEELLWGSVPLSDESGKAIGWFAGAETPAGEQRETIAFVVCASP
jgi:hypothetical protein